MADKSHHISFNSLSLSKGLGKWSERSLIMSILSYDRCCGVKIELFTCNHIARLKPHPSLPLDGERELNFTESFIIQSSLIKRGKHSSLVLQTIYWRCFHNHREGLLLDKSTYYQLSLSHLRHYDKLGCRYHHHKGRVTLWIDANQPTCPLW